MTSPSKTELGKDISEDERLGTAIQKFVQTQSFNAFERMIASYIVQAITGDALEGVIFICRAALSLDEERCQLLGIDFQEAIDLYTVSQRLASANKSPLLDEAEYNVNFGTLDFGRQISPWVKGVKWYPFRYNQYYHDEIMEKMEERPKKSAFLYACSKLTETGYKSMISDFLIYAMPKSQDFTRKLSELVSPATWHETYALVSGSDFTRIKEPRK